MLAAARPGVQLGRRPRRGRALSPAFQVGSMLFWPSIEAELEVEVSGSRSRFKFVMPD